jgi:hypothetical protein
MKRYRFLFKPLFFIFSLLFACWMVLAIEKVRPSDFGKYSSLFETNTTPIIKGRELFKREKDNLLKKNMILKLCSDYKIGKITTIQLNQRLEQILKIQ